jgi:hypothetical protein
MENPPTIPFGPSVGAAMYRSTHCPGQNENVEAGNASRTDFTVGVSWRIWMIFT